MVGRKSKDLPEGLNNGWQMAVAIEHDRQSCFGEPTSGADIPARRFFWRIISELASQGATVIVTTHFMEEALYCDRLMIQDQGRCLIMGSPKDVLKIMQTWMRRSLPWWNKGEHHEQVPAGCSLYQCSDY